MENIEILLMKFSKDMLDVFIADRISNELSEIKTSHFYDNNLEKDLELHEIDSLCSLLSPRGTGNVFLNKIDFGLTFHNVVVVFSFDEIDGDIVINFEEDELRYDDVESLRNRISTLIEFLSIIKTEYKIPVIRVGFEPASDDDMLILELNDGNVEFDEVINKIINI